jgi:hypothetical protein
VENMTQGVDFSKYRNVFCDSVKALEWAYQQGLPRDSIIRTSSPAMLWTKNPNIVHIESCWSVDKMQEFQTTIQKFSEDIFDASVAVNGVKHEQALCISKASIAFQRKLFKAACIEADDLTESRLIIQVNSKQYGSRNAVNPPWKDILVSNPKACFVNYTLRSEKWSTLSTYGVPWWRRLHIAGWRTFLYRLLIRLEKYFPSYLFKRQIMIPNENELSIEIAFSLALRRCRLVRIEEKRIIDGNNNCERLPMIDNAIRAVVAERINKWVTPTLTESCTRMFLNEVHERLELYEKWKNIWTSSVSGNSSGIKSVLMINSPVTTKWLPLVNVCRKKNIPVVSVQHGVTQEINASGEAFALSDINASDCFIAYNKKSADIAQASNFILGKTFVSGISGRHLRMKALSYSDTCMTPIVYISTRLYKGNIGGIDTWMTDYGMAQWEYNLINNVFNKLPHKVRYKTYPEETRRYADPDIVSNDIASNCSNIELFDEKVDMRYLVNQHQVLVTSYATSTVSWAIMSGRPVVFINAKNNGALSQEAYESFKEGIFVFDDVEDNFHENLKNFLSKPIEEIMKLWGQKKTARDHMIHNFFTPYSSDSGKRAAEMIVDKYL